MGGLRGGGAGGGRVPRRCWRRWASRTRRLEPTRVYRYEDARIFLEEAGLDVDALTPEIDGRFMSAFVRATQAGGGGEAEGGCCAPGCCG